MVWQVLKWAVFVVLVIRMVRAGFFGAPRLFTWPMFVRVSNCRMDLHDETGLRINEWDHIVHQDPGMNAWELQCYLAFLREVRGIRAAGTVEILDHSGRHLLTVRDGHVVV